MIHSVTADNETFKSVAFGAAFNVVLAERREAETGKSSRNGVGKSSLIDIIHFCLGADVERNTVSAQAIRGWTYNVTLDVGGHPVTVSRSPETKGRVFL